MTSRRIFVSHAKADKRALSPLFSELVRSGLPLYLDQKAAVLWDEDVRNIVYRDETMVAEIRTGDFNQKIERALADCDLFLGLFTDAFSAQDCGGWKELDRYYLNPNRPGLAAPMLVQALPITVPLKTPYQAQAFLDDDRPTLNIQETEPDYFSRGEANRIIADRVALEFEESAFEIVRSARRLQRNSARRWQRRVVRSVSIRQHLTVSLTYVPADDEGVPGCYVSEQVLSATGPVADRQLSADEALALDRSLPGKIGLIDMATFQRLFAVDQNDRVVSLYGTRLIGRDSAFWTVCPTGLVAVLPNGQTVDRSSAYFLLKV